MPLVQLFRCYLLVLALSSCHQLLPNQKEISTDLSDSLQIESKANLKVSRSGKMVYAPKLQDVYTQIPLDSLLFPIIDGEVVLGLENQLELLKLRKQSYNQQIGNLSIQLTHLERTVNLLLQWRHIFPINFGNQLEAHQIWGKDQRGNIQFTAYYAPTLKISATQTPEFPYPIRSAPQNWEGVLPSREAIESGVLDNSTSILGYAASKVDIYYLQLQGSGYVEYPNDDEALLTFDGDNNHPYISIEKHLLENKDRYGIKNTSMNGVRAFLDENPTLVDSILNINPSYTFFKRGGSNLLGAGHVPLSPNISIAVDPKYIPLGSCLLAAMPVVNKKGVVIAHEFRLLLAQDVGGAIRGPGHIDIYMGAGKAAQKMANNFNHYGQLWLLLPKDKSAVKTIPVENKLPNLDFESWFSS